VAVTGLVALTVALACQVARAQDLAVMGARVYVSPQAEAVRESGADSRREDRGGGRAGFDS
jgi:hypothetical protein